MSECKTCKPPKRYPGCQDHCPIGIAVVEEAKKRREARQEAYAAEVEKNSYLRSNTFRRRWRRK